MLKRREVWLPKGYVYVCVKREERMRSRYSDRESVENNDTNDKEMS